MVKGTRPRAVPAIMIGFLGLGSLYQLVGATVLAVNFTTADQEFQLYSNYLQGVSAGGFIDQNRSATAVGQVGTAEIGIKQAQLDGLCAIATQSLAGIGTVSLMITAGDTVAGAFTSTTNPTVDGAGNPISYDANGLLSGSSATGAINATDLFINTNALTGYGNKISGLNLGQNAADVATAAQLNNGTGTWPTGQTAPVNGGFGLTANQLNIGAVNGASYGINLAGQINLPKLRISVLLGAKTQSDCPVQAQ